MTHKTSVLTAKSLMNLDAASQPPCFSLYQPTHRRHPENKQDPIRFGNLVMALGISLQQKYPDAAVQRLLEPYDALAQDRDFWNHTLEGLAVLGGPSLFQVFQIQRPVPELAIVADSFHTKPLRRFLQSGDRYQVLGLSLHKIQLFEGDRNVLDEIEPAPDVPKTMAEALGEEMTESHSAVASYGGAGQSGMPMHHGHGGKKEEAEIDMERFCRAIDHAVLERHSRPSGLPLILAALPEHHHVFRAVSHNPFLMAEGLTINPDVLHGDQLRERVWKIIEPEFQARAAKLADEFALAESRGLGSDKLTDVAQAAASGRVATLLIENERQIAGRLDDRTGEVQAADLDDPQVDDLLDDLGELVMKKGGHVLVIPAEQMPVRTGIAATYRY